MVRPYSSRIRSPASLDNLGFLSGRVSPVICRPLSIKHDQYYFEDGTIVLEIESTLYRIHRYILIRDSPLFRDTLVHPPGNDEAQGNDDYNPMKLEGQSKEDFDVFLSFYYPQSVVELSTPSTERLATFLQVAHKYQFNTQFNLVFQKLQSITSPAESISIIRKYPDRDEGNLFLIKAFKDLCSRPPPTDVEGALLESSDLLLHWRLNYYKCENEDLSIILDLVLNKGKEFSEALSMVRSGLL